MYQICRHIKTNGQRCQSRALRTSAYCYFHARVHHKPKAKGYNWDDIELPLMEDSAAIQIAISRIADACLNQRLDARRTGLLLYAVQIAAQNLARSSSPKDSEPVHAMGVNEEGDELAPIIEICEPNDCACCNRRHTCPDRLPEGEKPGCAGLIISSVVDGRLPSQLATGECGLKVQKQ
jgi:hypothetical protein